MDNENGHCGVIGGNMNTPLLAAWFTWIAVLLFFIGLDLLKEPDKSLLKLLAGAEKNTNWQQIAEQFGPVFAAFFPIGNLQRIEQRLVWAGKPFGLSSSNGFIGLKVILLLIGVFIGVFFSLLGLPSLFAFVSGLIGYIGPDLLLTSLMENRQKAIFKAMPNMIGLLATAIRSGMELGPAMEMVGKNIPGPLGDEMRMAWREIATGRPRAAALKAMAKRTGVFIVERFVETIVTAEERGSERISDVLTAFMADLRASQTRKAQEEARKIPTKMLLPLILCILLPMIVMLATPVAFTLLKAL